MKRFKFIFSIFVVLASLVLCQQVISNSREAQHYKYESAELNHIKYGLFSIDTWKGQISEIIASEIDKL